MVGIEFEDLVNAYYAPLYRFGLSLTKSEALAADLTQQTFYLWATRGHQLRDRSKAKAWLFTTLYREFLGNRRHTTKFRHVEFESAASELPSTASRATAASDGATALACLQEVDEVYRAPLTLFYLEEFSYKQIAELLRIPIGTVMSRLSRGKEQLRNLLSSGNHDVSAKRVVPFSNPDLKTAGNE
jgi:RNA polymerase sigma factor (sigma-70 family)